MKSFLTIMRPDIYGKQFQILKACYVTSCVVTEFNLVLSQNLAQSKYYVDSIFIFNEWKIPRQNMTLVVRKSCQHNLPTMSQGIILSVVVQSLKRRWICKRKRRFGITSHRRRIKTCMRRLIELFTSQRYRIKTFFYMSNFDVIFQLGIKLWCMPSQYLTPL